MLTIPDLNSITGSTGYDAQAFPDPTDVAAIAGALDGIGVVSGCAVTAVTAMKVAVAAGKVVIGGVAYTVTSFTPPVATASSTDRRDAVVVKAATKSTALTLYATKTKTGTLAKLSTSSTTTATATHAAHTGTYTGTKWAAFGLGTAKSTSQTTEGAFGTGNGAVYLTSLTGKTVSSGTWSVTIPVKTANAVTFGALHLRIGVKAGASFTQLGSDLVVTTVACSSSGTTVTFTGSLPVLTLGSSTRLYVELWAYSPSTAPGTVTIPVGTTSVVVTTPGAALIPLVVEGTPCTTAGWVRTARTLAPMKPAMPSASALLAEVYVPGSASSVAAKNLVDKRCLILGGNVVAATAATAVSLGTTGTVVVSLSLGVGIWVIVATVSMASTATKRTRYSIGVATGTAAGTFTGPVSASALAYATPKTTSAAVRTIAVVFRCTVAGTVVVTAGSSSGSGAAEIGSGAVAYRTG